MLPVRLPEQRDLFFAHPHLTGSTWPEPPRHPFDDRVAAVAEVGSTGMGMATYELDELLRTRSPDDLRGVLADHGVRIGELEVLLDWHTDDVERVAEKVIVDYAGMFGATRVKAAAFFFPPAVPPPPALLVERFAGLCDRAADHGLTIALEPVALFPEFSYAVAADMVVAADRPNGGLLFDAWQTFRDPTGMSTLDRIAARHVTGVELADGHATPRGALDVDCLNHRLLPGAGDFDLVRFLRALDAKGVEVPLSVEVLSAELRDLTPRDNARRTVSAFRDLLAEVRES